jgi:hypothetical protein
VGGLTGVDSNAKTKIQLAAANSLRNPVDLAKFIASSLWLFAACCLRTACLQSAAWRVDADSGRAHTVDATAEVAEGANPFCANKSVMLLNELANCITFRGLTEMKPALMSADIAFEEFSGRIAARPHRNSLLV